MLLLTRKQGASVDIIDSRTQEVLCTVTLLEILPNKEGRLGFNALDHISIVRDDAIKVLKRGKGEGNGRTS